MKILLFGKNGQLGWELQRSLQLLGDVVALDRHSADVCGDLSDLEGLQRTVEVIRPDIIVNAAAHTAVDRAQSEPELARVLNSDAPAVLAQCAERIGAWLIHYSTDYVFDGSGHTPWLENDKPAPLNIYGATKLEGEQRVRSLARRHLIFRTSWVYAARGGNFAKTMLRLAKERDRLTVIDDQFGTPTGADLLADVTAHAIRQVIPQTDAVIPDWAGVYHLTASGETSWHAYAQFVLRQAESAGIPLLAGSAQVDPVPSHAFVTPARRPANSRLNTLKLRERFGLHLPPWQHGVARMLAEIF